MVSIDQREHRAQEDWPTLTYKVFKEEGKFAGAKDFMRLEVRLLFSFHDDSTDADVGIEATNRKIKLKIVEVRRRTELFEELTGISAKTGVWLV